MATPANSNVNDDSRAERFGWVGKLAYAVFWINVLALLTFLVGLFAGWFWPEATLVKDGQYRLSVVFNTKEAADDMSDVATATKNTLETGASAVEMETTEGAITKLLVGRKEFTVTDGEDKFDVHVTEATEWETDGANDLSAMQIGDLVRVTLRQKGDKYFAIKVADSSE